MKVTVGNTKSSPQLHRFRQLTRITRVVVIDRFTLDFDGANYTYAARFAVPGEQAYTSSLKYARDSTPVLLTV